MIIDGKKEAANLREEIKKEILLIKEKTNKVPKLSVILIGDFAPSQIYVRNKEKSSKEVGINSDVIRYPKDVPEKERSHRPRHKSTGRQYRKIRLSYLPAAGPCGAHTEAFALSARGPLPRRDGEWARH